MLAHLCKAPLHNLARGRDKKTPPQPAAASVRRQPRATSASRCHDDRVPATPSISSVPKKEDKKTNKGSLLSETHQLSNTPIKRSKSYGEISCQVVDNEGRQAHALTRDDVHVHGHTTLCNKAESEITNFSKDGCAVNSKVRCSGVLQRMRRFRLKHVLETHGKDGGCSNLSHKSIAEPSVKTPSRSAHLSDVQDTVRCERLEPTDDDDEALDATTTLNRKYSSDLNGRSVNRPLVSNHTTNRNPRPDLITSVLERTETNSNLPPDESSSTGKVLEPEPSCSQRTAPPEISTGSSEKNSRLLPNTIPRFNNTRKIATPKKCISPFGYDIDDITAFLQSASRTQPANIPMVLTQNVVIRSTGGVIKRNNFSVPMGNVVNAMYKTGAWVYVRTAHGSEGLLPYKACVPLGILPANNRHSAPWELDNSFFDTVATEYAYPSICNVVEVNSTIAEQVEVNPVLQKKPEETSEVLYENLDFLVHIPTPSFDLDDVSCGDGNGELDELPKKPPFPNKTDTQKLMEFSSTTLPDKPTTPVPTEPVQHPPASTVAQDEVQVMVVCDYIAKGQDRITVTNGEMVTLLQRTSADWLLVRTSSGLQGLIPTAYTTIGTQCFL